MTAPSRFDLERAIVRSTLAPTSRHILHVLCCRIHHATGAIRPQDQPSLSILARDIGRDRRTVMRHLRHLEVTGWLVRARPPPDLARTKHQRTAYTIRLPPGLGAEHPVAGGIASPELGAEDPGARGTMPPRTSETSLTSGEEDEIGIIVEELAARTGKSVSREWAARVRAQLLGRSGIRHSAGYLRHVIAHDPDPGRFLPITGPPKFSELFRDMKGKSP